MIIRRDCVDADGALDIAQGIVRAGGTVISIVFNIITQCYNVFGQCSDDICVHVDDYIAEIKQSRITLGEVISNDDGVDDNELYCW